MTERTGWEYYKYKRYLGILSRKVLHTGFSSYAGRKLMDPDAGNRAILERIEAGGSFAAARFGSVELSAVVCREAKRLGKKAANTDRELCTNAGFFPEREEYIDQFCEMILKDIPQVDLLGIWYNPEEEYIVDRYMPHTEVMPIESIEPYVYQNPWSSALKNKNVLVIHPFAESIQEQYGRREKIFDDLNVLPDFQLKTLKAVQTQAEERDSRFENWFQALNYMKEQMDYTDYDIAVIGCGAYGMPLAIHAKRQGKQAVHMGGATQILFGIKGRRWDDNAIISKLYNEFWIRPNRNETIEKQDLIENGCYW